MKKSPIFYLTILLLALFGCQTEESGNEIILEIINEENVLQSGVERISTEELSNDTNFMEMSSSFGLRQTFETAKNSSSLTAKSGSGELEVDFASAKKLTTENLTSYTFLADSGSGEPNVFENLVVEKTADGKIRGYLIRYEPEQYWDEGSEEPFKGNVSISPYSQSLGGLLDKINGKGGKETTKDCGRIHFFTIFVEYSCTGTNHHGSGEHCPCGTKYDCDRAYTTSYTFDTYVPCNDFSNPTGVGGVGDGDGSGGGSGSLGEPGIGDNGSGSAILGPNGINVPYREYMVDGVAAGYRSHYMDYLRKSWNLFNFMESTNFVKYQKPQNKPYYKALKDVTGTLITSKMGALSTQDLKFLYGRQHLIMNMLDKVNFDYSVLPNEQKKELAKAAAFIAVLPEAKTIANIWPKTAEEWAVVGELFAQFLPELALGFIPGSSIVDVIRGVDQGDYVAMTLGIVGLVVDAFGGSVLKGVAKLGNIAYKTFKIFRIVHKVAKAMGVALKTGFKSSLAGDVVSLLNSSNRVVAKITNQTVEIITTQGLKLVDPGSLKTLVKKTPTSSGHISKSSLTTAKRFKPSEAGLKADFDALKNLDNNTLGKNSERLADKLFKQDQYLKQDAKIPGFDGNNGFDGVYIKKDASGNVTDIIINEVKQVSSSGTIQLSPANNATGLPRQMTNDWIANVVERMELPNTSQSVKNLAALIKANDDKITKVVTGIDKTNNQVLVFTIN